MERLAAAVAHGKLDWKLDVPFVSVLSDQRRVGAAVPARELSIREMCGKTARGANARVDKLRWRLLRGSYVRMLMRPTCTLDLTCKGQFILTRSTQHAARTKS